MKVIPITHAGNSSKFHVTTKNGEFTIAISFTLRTKIWNLPDDSIIAVGSELAEAIVSRHDPKLPFQKIYIFAEHNSEPDIKQAIQKIRKHGL